MRARLSSLAPLVLVQVAGAAFAGAAGPFSLLADKVHELQSSQGRVGYVASSAAAAAASTAAIPDADSPPAPPESRSAIPGILEVEDQPVRNPIGPTSHVLVVGGTRGIGLEFVRQCATRGADVVATHRDEVIPQSLKDLRMDLEETGAGGTVSGLRMDVTDDVSVSNAAEELRSRDGFRPLTHVIHSAGTYNQRATTFDGTSRGGRQALPPVTKDVMMDTFLTNAVGPLLVAQSFVPIMGASPEATEEQLPVFATVTSKVGSVHDNTSGGTYAYRASKSALNNVCKSLSVDLTGEVSVALLHPGYVRTDMTGGKGLIDVDESVSGMLRAVEGTDATVGFRFVDFKAELIPW